MEDNSSSNETCYFDRRFQALIGLRTSFSLISTFFIISMLGLIVLFRKYHFFTQRLIMYIAIAHLSFSVVNTFDLAALSSYENQSALRYCQMIGFFTQMTNWWAVLSILIISVDIFLKVAVSRINTEKYEILYLLIIFALPLSFNWIPFIKSSYGSSIYFCWIRGANPEDCAVFPFGLWLRLALYYAPLFTIMLAIFILLVAARRIAHREKTRFIGHYDPEMKRMREKVVKEMKPLVGYPIIFLIANVMSLISTTYVSFDPGSPESYALSVFNTIVFRLQGILITLVFVFDPETRKKLKWNYIKAAAKSFCTKSEIAVYKVQAIHSDSVNIYLLSHSMN